MTKQKHATPDSNEEISREALLERFERAENQGHPLIGTEFEAIAVRARPDGVDTISYEDTIRPVLDELCRQFGWTPGYDRGSAGEIIELSRNGASITLEPGGQLELSGAPLGNVHATCAEFRQHRSELHAIGEKLGITFLAAGFHPFAKREDLHWMPKGRYAVMRNYLPTRGEHALDMMLRTATVQVNLDYPDEVECGRRFVSMVKSSALITALFANSPYKEGKLSGYRSFRSRVWSDVDPDRCGLPAFAFDGPFSYERYADWVLNVPMFFIKRDGQYIPHHRSFAAFIRDGIKGPDGTMHRAMAADWELHLSTVFPEVRLKPFIEVRGADGVGHRFLCALPALTKGLLYDPQALDELEAFVTNWSRDEALQRWETARRDGMQNPEVRRSAKRILEIARGGLERLDATLPEAEKEAPFLTPLQEVVDSGKTLADLVIEKVGDRAAYDDAGRKELARAFYYAGAAIPE